jgi:folylpolyglutamate synthase
LNELTKDAITALNTLQTNSDFLTQLKKSGGRMNQYSLPEMREWMRRIDYVPEDLNRLNVIHIAGTKGKGSTCAFVASLLRHLFPGKTIGLFTSPHLKNVNERIQINSTPIAESIFARYFWEVWDRLEASAEKEGLDRRVKPPYFRYLTLMAWHTFLDMKVFVRLGFTDIGGYSGC